MMSPTGWWNPTVLVWRVWERKGLQQRPFSHGRLYNWNQRHHPLLVIRKNAGLKLHFWSDVTAIFFYSVWIILRKTESWEWRDKNTVGIYTGLSGHNWIQMKLMRSGQQSQRNNRRRERQHQNKTGNKKKEGDWHMDKTGDKDKEIWHTLK